MKNAVTLYLAVTLCLEKREEVPVSARASRDCLCGGLLAASYPYISQARGWTDLTSRLDHQQDSPSCRSGPTICLRGRRSGLTCTTE